jgi:hypothetical protein
MPQKSWAVGEEVLAADFNTYLQNQVVPQFGTNALRDSLWPAPPNGAVCITTDTNTKWQRIAGVWYAAGQRLGYAASPANAGPTGGATENVLAAIQLPAITIPTATRLIRVECGFRAVIGTAGDSATVRIREGTTTAGTIVTDTLVVFAPSGTQAGTASGCTFGRTYTPGAKTTQYTLTLQGTANPSTMIGNATGPIWLEARDVGPG